MITRLLKALSIKLFSITVDLTAKNEQTGQVTYGNLIAALNNINVQINNLEALNDLTVDRVRVVSADNLLQDGNIQALNNALNRNETEILNLRDVLNDNNIIQEALNNNNVAVNDVVAIDVLSGGDVVVFYQQ